MARRRSQSKTENRSGKEPATVTAAKQQARISGIFVIAATILSSVFLVLNPFISEFIEGYQYTQTPTETPTLTSTPTETPTLAPTPTETPIPITLRLDAVGIPAGWFIETGSPETYIKMERGEPIACLTDAICYRNIYKLGGSSGGIFYWPLSCGNTGSEDAWKKVREGTCGINVLEAGNLKSIDRITFWARGDHGGEVVEFKVGDADLLPIPGRSSGKVTLSSQWQRHEIGLVGLDLTNAIALFIWAATDIDNPQGAVFYLSEIQFEGVK